MLLGCGGVCWGAGRAAAGVLGGLLLGGWWGACSGYRLRCVPPCLRGVEKVHESDAKHDEDLRFRGVRLEASGGQSQQLEIADFVRDLRQNVQKKRLRKGSPQNALQSDFVKHSSNFGGSGVHLGSHFEGAFGARFSQIAKPPSRFQFGFAKSSMGGKTAKTQKSTRTHAFGNDSGPRTLPKAKK